MQELNEQVPSRGVMETDKFDDATVYKVACACGDNAHEHNVWIEIDPDIKEVSVTIYTRISNKYGFWKTIWDLLTRGYIEMETSILMTRQQALNYAGAMKNAVMDLDKKLKK
jgi:hypothetical protein